MALGDHIKVRRLKGLYTHHGIDMGDGTVIHFSGEPLHFQYAAICRSPIEDFLAGGKCRKVSYSEDTGLRSPEEAAACAASFLGEKNYDPWFRNCEHFATYCKTGVWKSHQVRRVAQVISATVIAGGIGVGIAGAALLKRRHRRSQ